MIAIDPITGFGLLISLLDWFRSEYGGRLIKEEILRRLESQDTIRDYLEWLRRKEQSQLLSELEGVKGDLMKHLPDVATQLSALAFRVQSAAGELSARIDDLNSKILPPVLYPTPLETRASAAVTLRGRTTELEFLKSQTGDALLIGQPGSGKTFLLQEFAQTTAAKFLLTHDPERAISAITVACPPVVIIDDAWQQQEIIKRLRHIRSLHTLPFRIVAVCWPFDKSEMQQALHITPDKMLELELLPRPTIVEIIQEVAALRKVTVNDEFLRVVLRQARGLPGLAVALTIATIESSGQDLVSGSILLNQVGLFMQQHVAGDASTLLAAFACGGGQGIGVVQVAKALGKDIGATKAAAERVALAGTLEQTGKETLAIQPEFLRAALITHEFFPPEGGGLGWKLCEQLIGACSDPVSGYVELFRARASSGASIGNDLLRDIALAVNHPRIWTSLAWLDEHNCRWILSRVADLPADIKRAAMHYVPAEVLPKMLSGASKEDRALNIAPDADMRLIKDWIAESSSKGAFEPRKILFEATAKWMTSGGDVPTAFAAFSRALDLDYCTTDADPAKVNTLRLRSGMIGLDFVKQVFGLWPRFVSVVQNQKQVPWALVVQVVDKWSCAFSSFGKPLPADYTSFLEGCVKRMILDLLPLAKGNDAVGRWILLNGKRVGCELPEYPVSGDFMLLFPEENFDDDYQKREAEQAAAVEVLVKRLKDRPISDIVTTFSQWTSQAEALGGMWSGMPCVFCSKMAEQRSLTAEELGLVMDRLTPYYAQPFVRIALETGKLEGGILERCLASDAFSGILVEPALTGKAPHLYDLLSERLPKFSNLIRGLCARGKISDETLGRLLQHPDAYLRFEVALGLFRSSKPPNLAASLLTPWRSAIVDGIALILTSESRDHLHDLSLLLNVDPSIARQVLDKLLASGRRSHTLVTATIRAELVSRLSKDERKVILSKCTDLIYSDLPDMLVGGDLELYEELLAAKNLHAFHLAPLAGDPTAEHWAKLAKAAIKSGYQAVDVAMATQAEGFSWEGGLSSYYQQWIDRFENLRKSDDPDLQRIAAEGLKWAIPNRDEHRRREKKEEVDGWI